MVAGGSEAEAVSRHDREDMLALARDIAAGDSNRARDMAAAAPALLDAGRSGGRDRGEGSHRDIGDIDLRQRDTKAPHLILKPSQAANLLSSLASINHRDEAAVLALVSGIKRQLVSNPAGVPSSSVAKCLWALAVLDYRDMDFVQLAFQHYIDAQRRWARVAERREADAGIVGTRGQPARLSDGSPASPLPPSRLAESMRLFQAALWLQSLSHSGRGAGLGGVAPSEEAPENGSREEGEPLAHEILQGLPRELLAGARALWRDSASNVVMVSGLQKDVQAALGQHLRLEPKVRMRGEG